MVSDRKAAANRANAAKSTGPRSAAGLVKAAGNSVRHGLHVAAVVPALGESLEEFERFRLAVRVQLRPRGVLDGRLADRAALIAWRLDRVVRYEAALAQAAASVPGLPPDPDDITGAGIDWTVPIPADAPPARRLAYLRNRLGVWAAGFDSLRRAVAALGDEAAGDAPVAAGYDVLMQAAVTALGWPLRPESAARWEAAWQAHHLPADRPPTGAEVRGLLAALAKEANRDPAEVVRAVRERLAARLAGDEKGLVDARNEADRLAAGLKAAREAAVLAAAYADDAAVERVIRLEGHLARQLEVTLELFDRVRSRGRRRAGAGGPSVVVRGLAARVAELGVAGPAGLPDGVGSFRSGEVAGDGGEADRIAVGGGG